METDDDHATMRETFSLVQNILFIVYTEKLEKLWKAMQFGLVLC